MPPLKDSYANLDQLMTITMLFLDEYSGTYRSCQDLRTKLNAFLDEEYDGDLSWLNREKDMDVLVILVVKSGGVSVGKSTRCLSLTTLTKVAAQVETLSNNATRAVADPGQR